MHRRVHTLNVVLLCLYSPTCGYIVPQVDSNAPLHIHSHARHSLGPRRMICAVWFKTQVVQNTTVLPLGCVSSPRTRHKKECPKLTTLKGLNLKTGGADGGTGTVG